MTEDKPIQRGSSEDRKRSRFGYLYTDDEWAANTAMQRAQLGGFLNLDDARRSAEGRGFSLGYSSKDPTPIREHVRGVSPKDTAIATTLGALTGGYLSGKLKPAIAAGTLSGLAAAYHSGSKKRDKHLRGYNEGKTLAKQHMDLGYWNVPQEMGKTAYVDQFASDPYTRESVTTDAHGVGRLLSGRTNVEILEDPAMKKRPIPARPERRAHQTKLSYMSDYSAKEDPENVGYDEMGGMQSQRCGKCVYFLEPNGCEAVRGTINSDGICDLFDPDPMDKTGSARQIMLTRFLEKIAGKKPPSDPMYDKCWEGYRKVPGKKRGEEGSCKKASTDFKDVSHMTPQEISEKHPNLMSEMRKRMAIGAIIGAPLGYGATRSLVGTLAGAGTLAAAGAMTAKEKIAALDVIRIVKLAEKKKDFQLKKKHKNPEGGLNAKGRRAYNRATGSNLKAPQPEGGSRRDSFCARMGGMKKKLTSEKTKNDPDSRINKALRKWNC